MKKNQKKVRRKQLLNFLEVLDAFDRVFGHIKQKEDIISQQMRIWINNFRSVRRILWNALKDAGVKTIENPGGKAIPGNHTIVETKEVSGLEDETIIETIQKGLYMGRGSTQKREGNNCKK